jgi:hypothetical protein
MMKFLYQRYKTTGEIKQMGMRSRSKNGCGEWVALCTHPTHTHTDKQMKEHAQEYACFPDSWSIFILVRNY